MKWELFGLSLVLLVGAVVLISPPSRPCPSFIRVSMPNGEVITAEVAANPQGRALGLGQRDFLPPDWGMLFLFPESGFHSFWMKETRIALDIIWLRGRMIVDIATLSPPQGEMIPSYTPLAAADAVLELNSGATAAYSLSAGQNLRWGVDCPRS